MSRIEIEWLCKNGHVHSNYPLAPNNANLNEFAVSWLENVTCGCGGPPISYAVFAKGE